MACKTCGQETAELLGMLADLSLKVVALQAKLDLGYYCLSPAPSGSLTLHSDHRTDELGHRYRIRYTFLNNDIDGNTNQGIDLCPSCEGVQVCICSDEEQLAFLLPASPIYTMEQAAELKSKHTRSNGKLTSNRLYCEFCFTKTGKQFFHTEINCNRKRKFSKIPRANNQVKSLN
jgi:hypothetical protein